MALSQDGFHQDPPHGSVSKEEVVEVLDDTWDKADKSSQQLLPLILNMAHFRQ